VAEELSGLGVPVWLCNGHAPTPALSLAVRDLEAAAAVIVTASHNPPEYNGIKLKPEYGSSGLPEIMDALALFVNDPTPAAATTPADIRSLNPMTGFNMEIARLVDLDRLRATPVHVVADPMHGAGIGVMPPLLEGGALTVQEIRGTLNPLFGGVNPEPIDRNLDALRAALTSANGTALKFGIAVDGDADRVGAMDGSGRFYNSHEIFAILLWHLVERRGWKGDVVKTFSTSAMIDILAERLGLRLHETPVGFKYIVEHMLAHDVLIGGEESGGIGVRDHIPERDGVLSGLLLLEACAWERESLPQVLARIHKMTGTFAYDRIDLHLPSRAFMDAFMHHVKTSPPTHFNGRKVADVLTVDGVKCVLEDRSWILFRPSGTEPVLRVYVEASSEAAVAAVLEEGRRLALEPREVKA
jgi:phosphomannomutase